MSSKLHFHFETILSLSGPVTGHSFRLCCLPPEFPGQRLTDSCVYTDPFIPLHLQRDGFGNLIETGFISDEHTSFSYVSEGTVVLNTEERIREYPNPVFHYETPLTALTEEMRLLLPKTETVASAVERSELALQLAHNSLQYASGSTKVCTSAGEAFAQGSGVCQDFTHVFLAFARAMGLSARYCSGLVPGEGESHAWAEVNLEGVWTGFDPTRGKAADDTYIRLGVGRDFEDCPIERGIFTGIVSQKCISVAKVEVLA